MIWKSRSDSLWGRSEKALKTTMSSLAMLNRFVRAIFLPPATLSRAGLLLFLPALQPPLTGARPTGGAPANQALQHPSVHPRAPFRLSNAPLFEKHFKNPTFKSRPLSINFRAPFHLTNTGEVKAWWILGVIAILVGIYWLFQSALVKYQHDLPSA